MQKTIHAALAMAGIALSLAIAPAVAQSDDHSNMKMSTMTDKNKMMALDKMSKEEKAAMFDKMSNADKTTATKMAGHDMSKMSAPDRMAMVMRSGRWCDRAMGARELHVLPHPRSGGTPLADGRAGSRRL